MSGVHVVLDWDAHPQFIVDGGSQDLQVTAHPGLSQAQVAHACQDLGEQGDLVWQAWQKAVGLPSEVGVSASAS